MNLDELSEAWNTLRNDALGQGVVPNVGPALAKEVAREYAAWRKALKHMPAAADMMASVYTRGWVTKFRRLRAKVKSSGVKVTAKLPQTPFEQGLIALDTFGRNIAIGAGVGGVLIIGFILATRGGRRG